jgi:F-box protein, helicase, 18
MVEIVKEYGNEIPSLIQSLKKKHVGDEEKATAEMIFSTVHRAKGMEYDAVQLVEDFITEAKLEKLKEGKEADALNLAKWNEEINLLYVAITRTKGNLRIPENLLPKSFPASPNIHVLKAEKKEVMHEGFGSKKSLVKSRRATQSKQQEKTVSYTERRLQQKNTSERWTPELDAELKRLYYKGTMFSEIVEHFGRKGSAVLSRLKKLGCVDYEE